MATQPNFATVEPPRHVPADHIVDFDYFHPQGLAEGDIYTALKRLHAHPDLFWTPRNGGHWVSTRADDIRWIRDDHAIFSHEEMAIPRGSINFPMPPMTVDPPLHARYRAVLNPAFTPGKVRGLTDKTRAVAVELIEQLKPRGHCEFVNDFARVMPVVVFLSIMDLPTDRRAEFVKWAGGYTTASDQETKDASAAAVADYLRGIVDERAVNPGDDLLSRIAGWRKNPRFQDEAEVMGMAMISFIGGLDTVANLISFTAWHLARDTAARQRLIDDPTLIPRAAEEYLRRHGVNMTSRLIKREVTHKGVTLHPDDMILIIDGLASLDEREWADPFAIDYDRDARAHDTFGNGAHKCPGEHLARMEIIVFIEEWLKRIPDFRIDPDKPALTYSGPVIGMSQLALRWD